MVGVRKALIVATDKYSDPKLTSLNAPAEDARVLADVLRDEAVGGYRVETVFNRPTHEVELAIAGFFGSGKYGDTLLAHFSCHGVKSPSGELYLATINTDLSDTFKLKVTGVPSALVRDAMEESRASLILCLVDCCYSGAFVKLAKAADTVDLTERLGGKGRAVITASTSLQLALDGVEEPSLFTHAVIEGLRSGEADRDLDGLVSLDELYNFVHDRVTSRNANQTPVKSFDVQGEVYVARRSTPVARPAPLESDLLADARASATYKRLGAVDGLATVLSEQHPGRSLAARSELSRLANHDDSLSVRDRAQAVLNAAGEPPTPVIPDYDPAALATRGGPGVKEPPVTEGAPDQSAPSTEVATETATETTTDEDAETEDESPDAVHGRWPVNRVQLVIVLAVLGTLAVGGFTWFAMTDDGTSGGGTAPVLSDSEILLFADDPEQGEGIFGMDAETGSLRLIIDGPDVGPPTISADRRWLVYLNTEGEDRGGVPRLARVDGSDDAPLLDVEASNECPFTRRPAFSQDGQLLAAICLDVNREPVGLGIIDREGQLVRLLMRDDFDGGPTWTGDGRIVVMRDPEGDGTTTLWVISPDGEDQAPVTNGVDGSDSHPDWSDNGLLFLRTRDGSKDVFHLDSLEAPDAQPITVSGTATSPAWSPSSQPTVLWLEPAKEGAGKALWTANLDGAPPTEVNTGVYGPPAWGSR
jgi:hypothetical protein